MIRSDEVFMRIRMKDGTVLDMAATPESDPVTLEALTGIVGDYVESKKAGAQPVADEDYLATDEMLMDAGVDGDGEIEAIFAVAADGSETQVFPVQ